MPHATGQGSPVQYSARKHTHCPREGSYQTLEQQRLRAVKCFCHGGALPPEGVQGTARRALAHGQRYDLPRAAPVEAVSTAAVAVAVEDPEGPGW